MRARTPWCLGTSGVGERHAEEKECAADAGGQNTQILRFPASRARLADRTRVGNHGVQRDAQDLRSRAGTIQKWLLAAKSTAHPNVASQEQEVQSLALAVMAVPKQR